jgi:hypothetical protein
MALRPHPNTKPWRPPTREAVTILAGFKCSDGIVICADTQETVSHSKRRVPKLRFEQASPFDFHNQCASTRDLAVAFCGAGEGPFIDKLIDNAWRGAKDAISLEECCIQIEQVIKDTYQEFGLIYQPGYCPSVDLIYGVKMEQESRLFTAHGPVVVEKDSYASEGCGYYMADFLASRMYSQFMTTRQGVILAAYILFQSKEHVDGCGGESHIAVLRKSESSGLVDWGLVKELTEILKFADSLAGQILLQTSDMDLPQENYRKTIKAIVESLDYSRDFHKGKLGKLCAGM